MSACHRSPTDRERTWCSRFGAFSAQIDAGLASRGKHLPSIEHPGEGRLFSTRVRPASIGFRPDSVSKTGVPGPRLCREHPVCFRIGLGSRVPAPDSRQLLVNTGRNGSCRWAMLACAVAARCRTGMPSHALVMQHQNFEQSRLETQASRTLPAPAQQVP